MACAFTFDQVMDILREQLEIHAQAAVSQRKFFQPLTQSELIGALLNQQFSNNGTTAFLSQQDAQDIVDEYYGTYQRFFNEIGKKRLNRFREIINDFMAPAMGTGSSTQLIPPDMVAVMLRDIDKAYLLDGSARERQLEKVNDLFLRTTSDTYNTDKVAASVYLLPLLSVRFFLAVLTSNGSVMLQRGLLNRFQNGWPKDAAEDETGSAIEYMRKNFVDVFKGGISQKTVTEAEVDMKMNARPEEFAINKTGSAVKDGFLNMARLTAKMSARVNNAFDSAGMSYSTEIWLYNVLKASVTKRLKARGLKINKSVKRQIEAEVFKAMYPPNAVKEAVQETEKMYVDAGFILKDSGPNTDTEINRNSAQFKRSVMDVQRRSWNKREVTQVEVFSKGKTYGVGIGMAAATQMANRFAAIDFFKQPMQIRKDMSGYEMFDRGIGGVLASLAKPISTLIHKSMSSVAKGSGVPERYANLMADKATLQAVGYINGANAFIEQILELTPYGFIKAGMLQLTTKDSSEDAVYAALRTRDVFAKAIYGTVMAAVFYGITKAIQEMLCDSDQYQGNVSNRSANEGKGFVMCGYEIPVWAAGMQGPMVGFINLMLNNEKNISIESVTAFLNLIGFRYSQPGMVESASKYMSAKNEFEEQSALRSIMKIGADEMAKLTFGTLPIPSRLIAEGTQLFKIDSQVAPEMSTVPQYLRWSFLQTIGLKEQMMDASGDNPVFDYRGREVLSSWMKFNVSDGIRYDKVDQFFSSLEIEPKLIYNSRYRILNIDNDGEIEKRYPTAEEYSESQRVIGELLNDYLVNNYDYLVSEEQSVSKTKIETMLEDLERYSKMAMENTDVENYEAYIVKHIRRANKNKERRRNARKGEGSTMRYKWSE